MCPYIAPGARQIRSKTTSQTIPEEGGGEALPSFPNIRLCASASTVKVAAFVKYPLRQVLRQLGEHH